VQRISVKALLLGNLSNVLALCAMAFIFMVIDFGIIVVSQGVDGLRDVKLTGVSLYVVALLPAASAVVSGYVAALYAKESPLLNGALSTAVIIAVSLYSDVIGIFPPSDEPAIFPPVVGAILSYSDPLFGLLGAHLRPMAEPRTILRWIGAVAALIGGYVLALVLSVLLFLWWKSVAAVYFAVMFAPRFSIIAGTYAAPKHLREQALVVLTGIAVVAPTAATLGLASARHSSAWLVIVLFNALGCLWSYWSMKRAWALEARTAPAE